MAEIIDLAATCLGKFRAGTLVEEDLQALCQCAERPSRQSLLYLQAPSTHPYSSVIGISLFEEGRDPEGLDENGQFLYRSIREALEDGWRIVRFPDLAAAMDDQNNYGLGYEFILERWR